MTVSGADIISGQGWLQHHFSLEVFKKLMDMALWVVVYCPYGLRLAVGLDLRGLLQPNQVCDSVIIQKGKIST